MAGADDVNGLRSVNVPTLGLTSDAGFGAGLEFKNKFFYNFFFRVLLVALL